MVYGKYTYYPHMVDHVSGQVPFISVHMHGCMSMYGYPCLFIGSSLAFESGKSSVIFESGKSSVTFESRKLTLYVILSGFVPV